MRLRVRPGAVDRLRYLGCASAIALLFTAGCSSPAAPSDDFQERSAPPSGGSAPGAGGGAPGTTANGDVQHCIAAINAYRAQAGLPDLVESASIDAYAAAGAASDARTGSAHAHFAATRGGNGVAFAENEVPGWPLAQFGSVTGVLDAGMKMMWNEGPGGGPRAGSTGPRPV